jgi:TPR repeat protein
MNRASKTVVVALIVAAGIAGSAAAGPFEDGTAAYNRRDYVTAMRLLRPIAEQGNAEAQKYLGDMYFIGQSVPKDYAAAASWYRKAADQGYAAAQYSLGLMYAHGQSVPQDYAAAANWYRKAADQGDATAQLLLGIMYTNGQGVPQDYISAHMWYNLGAAAGHQDAAKIRDIVAARMTPAQIAEAQWLAREWKTSRVAATTDTIQILIPARDPEGGDAVTIQVRYGAKNATVMLRPGYQLSRMTDADWREELIALAEALQHAPIGHQSE